MAARYLGGCAATSNEGDGYTMPTLAMMIMTTSAHMPAPMEMAAMYEFLWFRSMAASMPNMAPELGSAPPIVAAVAMTLAKAAGSTPVAR